MSENTPEPEEARKPQSEPEGAGQEQPEGGAPSEPASKGKGQAAAEPEGVEKPEGAAPPEDQKGEGLSKVGMARTVLGVGLLLVMIFIFWYVAFYRHTASYFASRLKSSNVQTRIRAAQQLEELGEDAAPAMVALTEALNDDVQAVQMYASRTLEGLGDDLVKALPHLIRVLETGKPDGQRLAMNLVARLGEDGRDAMPTILDLLDADDALVRTAVSALEAVAPRERAAQDAYFSLFDHGNSGVRSAAASAATRLAREDAAVYARLKDALEDKPRTYRVTAIEALGNMRGAAADAVGKLFELAGDDNRTVRVAALEALVKIVPEDPNVVPFALKAAQSSNRSERSAGLSALGDMGARNPAAPDAIREILPSLDEGSTRTRLQRIVEPPEEE